MSTVVSPQIREVVESMQYRPCVTIIMPFEPKMEVKSEMKLRIKYAGNQAIRDIRQNYQDDLADQVIHKLRSIENDLDYSTYRKSVAIFLSPVFKKVIYLDFQVQQTTIVDRSFHIRDILAAKSEEFQSLVVVLSAVSSKIFLRTNSGFSRLAANYQEHIPHPDLPERVADFSTPMKKKETELKRFLRYSDNVLGSLFHDYPFPVFVMAAKEVAGYFTKLTKNSRDIVSVIHGNFEDSTLCEIEVALQSAIKDWKRIKTINILNQIGKAADSGRLTCGIEDVWKQAFRRNSKLLVVEKNFSCGADQGKRKDLISRSEKSYHRFSYIRDAVDDLIESVLEQGGDVEFVEGDVLSDFDHICLIQYY